MPLILRKRAARIVGDDRFSAGIDIENDQRPMRQIEIDLTRDFSLTNTRRTELDCEIGRERHPLFARFIECGESLARDKGHIGNERPRARPLGDEPKSNLMTDFLAPPRSLRDQRSEREL